MTMSAPKDGRRAVSLTEEEICRRIRDSVLEQRLAPGTKLTEESLCSVFGVGRTTVRRAFLLLTRDNIVELQKNKGAVIASPTPEESRQVFEARVTLETALLEKAVEKATADDIAALRAHLEEEQDALAHADLARWIRLTGEFHNHLARPAQNEPLCHFLEQLVFRSSLIIAMYGRRGQTGTSCKGGEHEQLVDAMEARNLPRALDILRHHLETIQLQLQFDRVQSGQDLHQIFGVARAAS
jgi:DNA-binding GntR family transcriptional regulator